MLSQDFSSAYVIKKNNNVFCSGAPSSTQVVFLMKKNIEMILNVMYSVTTNKQKHTRLKVGYVSSFLCEITGLYRFISV